MLSKVRHLTGDTMQASLGHGWDIVSAEEYSFSPQLLQLLGLESRKLPGKRLSCPEFGSLVHLEAGNRLQMKDQICRGFQVVLSVSQSMLWVNFWWDSTCKFIAICLNPNLCRQKIILRGTQDLQYASFHDACLNMGAICPIFIYWRRVYTSDVGSLWV